MSSIGRQLQEARESRGWSLDDLARRTRIGVEHLRALEEDRHDALPEGPWRAAWIRTLCEELGVEEPIEAPEIPAPVVPLGVVRAIGLGAMFLVIGLFAWQRWGSVPAEITAPPAPRVRDQVVEIVAERNVSVKAWIDGQPALDTVLTGGESQTFE
ncbi:MAG: helix-turn-helix domain-containing protein, partial [Myxococcales bacterium]|nr:helix-turn-helix domain-containing protein [Myxococcales bacterium]